MLPTLVPFGFTTRSSILLAALVLGSATLAGPGAGPAHAAPEPSREVVVVVDSVRDWQALIAALPGDPEVIVLDGGRDGLSQMVERLVGRHGIPALHILSHGDVGKVQLGARWLDADSVADRRHELAALGHALRPGGDILLYGCAVAADGTGQPFLDALASATGSDVAASSDTTGAAHLGGNWTLEVTHGPVEATPLTPAAYDGLLVAFTDTFTSNFGSGVTTFQSTLGGVPFTYTFTADGDGGDFAWENANGAGNSPSVNALSSNGGPGVERITITRTDFGDFTFSGLFVNNTSGATVTVAGYRDGVLIGSAQTVPMGTASTLSFASLHVDEVRLTSPDFFGTNFDDFSGDTAPPLVPPSLTATGTNPTFTEGGSAVDLFSSVTAATNDAGQSFTGMTVTVTNVSNGTSERLSIDGTSVALGNGNSGSLTGGGTFSVSVAAGTATVTLTGLGRSNALMGTLVDGLTYSNVHDHPGATSRVVTITGISDNGGSNNTAAPNRASTVTMAPVNDAPTITAPGSIAVTEDVATAVTGITFGDVDAGNASVVSTFSAPSGSFAATSGGGVTVGGTASALTLTGSLANINTFLAGANLSYTTASNATANVTMTVAIDDNGNSGGSAETSSTTVTLTVTASNDAPSITAPGSISVTEDAATALSGVSFSDADAGSNAVTVTLSVPSGTLAATSGGGVTVGGTASAMTLAGSIANLNAYIAGSNVVFTTATDATANVTLTVGIDDLGHTGPGGSQTASTTVTLSVAAVNDAPSITAPGTIAATEDVATALTGLSFSDVDAGSASVAVTLSVPSGTLAATSGGGVTVGGTAGAMTLTGSRANINTFIAGSNLTYTTAADAASNVTLTVGINDAGNTGSGGAQTAATTVTLAVTSVNDAPTITAPASIAVPEDVGTALTSVSFADADAGSNPVTVGFSVPGGTLAATSGGGVTVGGAATALTLTGSIANLNTFVAGSNVTFTTASNATANVTLTLAISDNGHTGSGGAETASTTVTLLVSAVNDAPVNTVPAPQTVLTDGVLSFTVGNGNAVAVSDVDAGGGTVQVTLAVTNGLISLGNTTGLVFSVGSGTADVSMTFDGSLVDVNNALAGLSFAPTSGYDGPASLQITSNDLGLSGSGGNQTDSDVVTITVSPDNPEITSVAAASPSGTYKLGTAIAIGMTFDQNVNVDTTGGVPTLLLETGAIDRAATYLSGSGSSVLTFVYTVQAGDSSTDLDYATVAALAPNGAAITNSNGTPAFLTLPVPGGSSSIAGQSAIVVDGVVPAVTTVAVPAAGSYAAGQSLAFSVSFSEPVTVTGVPVLALGLDTGGPLLASYIAGSGSSTLQFAGTVQAGQDDPTGVTVDALGVTGATITDAAGNAATTTLTGVGSTSGVIVDTTAPGVTIGAPSVTSTISGPVSFDITYVNAASITVDVADVTLISTGTASATMALDGVGTTRTVTLSGITGTGTLALSLAAGTAADPAGNLAPAIGPSAPVAVSARALTSIYPTSGIDTGGVELTLHGAGFTTITSPGVSIGGVGAVALQVVDDATMRVVTPALPAGGVAIAAGQMVRTGAVDLVLTDAGTTIAALTGGYLPLARPEDAATDTDGDTMPDRWELRHGLDAVAGGDAGQDPDGDGQTNVAELSAGTHPRGTWTRHVAEGVSSDTMATALAVFNPGVARSAIVVHYLRDGASPLTETFDLEPGASLSRAAADVTGLAGSAFSTQIEASLPMVASSLTRWDANQYGAGAESVVAAAPTWHLAEGSTRGPFDLFYLLANPNATSIDVDITYLRPSPAAPLVQRVTVPARQRLTVWVDTVGPELSSTDVSAILSSVGHEAFVVERAMYAHDGSGRWGAAGHRAAGVTAPSTTWHLAEGFIGGPFDTYLLLANPQTVDATVVVDVLGATGVVASQTHVVPARARLTLYGGDFGVADGPVAFTARSASGQPVVVERAMWWRESASAASWVESHASAGATAGTRRWGLTDLRIGGSRGETQYVLVQNVEPTAVSVEVTLYLSDGQRETRSYVVAGASRLTLDVAAEFPAAVGRTSSAVLSGSGAIVVEASRYWDALGVRWGAGANLRGTPLP